MVSRSALPNGIRVVSEAMPGVPSGTVGIWVENGSRFETAAQNGISHFLEHLFFKGTERRTAAMIAEEIDAVGGVLNAFTSKEYTCYYAKVLAEHLPLAVDLLADIFRHSRFDPEEIDRERAVVMQEISQIEDTPDDYVHDLFNLHFWPGHPLGFPVCGRAENVQQFQQRDLLAFFDARYQPDRIIIAAAGNLTHATLMEWVEREFGDLQGAAGAPGGSPPVAARGVFPLEKDLEQVHICLGTPGISHTAPERYAAYLLSAALGGGMSSRLFQEVRERRGRAYSIYSFLSSFRDTGYLGIYAGTSSEWVEEVVAVICAEMRKLAETGLAPAELVRVKNQLKGNMLLGLESSDARMNRVARNEIYFGHDIAPEEVAACIDATANDEIIALARRLLQPGELAMALLGDLKGHALDAAVLGAAAPA
ncbi:MAG: insulinase family protein [Deltaproteobacteria bacterium]|nr:insulinase family protein [Deltaproteobacteria bacterium]